MASSQDLLDNLTTTIRFSFWTTLDESECLSLSSRVGSWTKFTANDRRDINMAIANGSMRAPAELRDAFQSHMLDQSFASMAHNVCLRVLLMQIELALQFLANFLTRLVHGKLELS
jgi:hypothetical protein